jgi:hypothetical protein
MVNSETLRVLAHRELDQEGVLGSGREEEEGVLANYDSLSSIHHSHPYSPAPCGTGVAGSWLPVCVAYSGL